MQLSQSTKRIYCVASLGIYLCRVVAPKLILSSIAEVECKVALAITKIVTFTATITSLNGWISFRYYDDRRQEPRSSRKSIYSQLHKEICIEHSLERIYLQIRKWRFNQVEKVQQTIIVTSIEAKLGKFLTKYQVGTILNLIEILRVPNPETKQATPNYSEVK